MHSKFFWCKIGMRNDLLHFFAEQQGSALWWEHSPPTNMFFRLLRSPLLSRRPGRVLRSMERLCASWVNDNNKYSNLLLNEFFFSSEVKRQREGIYLINYLKLCTSLQEIDLNSLTALKSFQFTLKLIVRSSPSITQYCLANITLGEVLFATRLKEESWR